jgi:hypothetical protein
LKYLKLQPWPTFKKEIFDIIDHRIEHAYEINGVINTSYMSLDEHLVVHMVHSFDNIVANREKKTGTKEDIQVKLCEFLLNLKYYSTRWERALLYSEMAGFMNAEENL